MYVGDNPWSDIGGAKSSGMRAIWMRTPFWPEPPDKDAVINSLEEIISLVGERG